MYRPNEIEEKRILELTKWIGKAKENSELPLHKVFMIIP